MEEERLVTEAVLSGDLSVPDKLGSSQVRAFISSTFTDTTHERNAILKNVVPEVRAFAKSLGFEFSPATMRWGVTKAHANEHAHAALCINEVKDCLKSSEGIAFISLLGQKFGFQPFPAVMAHDVYTKLTSALEQLGEDEAEVLALVEKWFSFNENNSPPTHDLLPITTHLPDYGNEAEPEKERAASGQWWAEFEKMQSGFRRALDAAGLTDEEKIAFLQSVTEHETRVGLMPPADADVSIADINKRTIWLQRNITDIEQHLEDPAARDFIDIKDGSLDDVSVARLKSVYQFVADAGLTNIKKYDVHWVENKGIDPENKDHASYIQTLCGDLEAALKESIRSASDKASALRTDSVFVECAHHAAFCRERVESFYGREDLVAEITSYFDRESSGSLEPLVVVGASGSGKTSVVAKAAYDVALSRKKEANACVVLRFIGTSSGSTTITSLLSLTIEQIYRNYDREIEGDLTQKDLVELFEAFKEALTLASKEKPLYVFFDSLDQLAPEGGARELRWMPVPTLPPHVHFVVSTLPNKNFKCFPRLQVLYSSPPIQVSGLSAEKDIPNLIDSWLAAHERSLTIEQRQHVLEKCLGCPYPLFVRLCLDETKKWASTTPLEECVLQDDIQSAINFLFQTLEEHHGELFVSTALGYITVAYRGLSDIELEDILSCNDEVLEQIFEWWLPPLRRLPPLLWARLRKIIGGFLAERGAGVSRVLSWHHRQFQEVAEQRYLEGEKRANRTKFASAIADYFQSRWYSKELPFVNSDVHQKRFNVPKEQKANRHVLDQPLTFKHGDAFTVNTRKLEELPQLLFNANRLEELVQLFCNFDWLLLKMRTTGKVSVMADFELLQGLPASFTAAHAELMSAFTLVQLSVRLAPPDADQLSSQLSGRLTHLRSNPHIDGLIKGIWHSTYTTKPTLICRNVCMDTPSLTKRLVCGHPDKVRGFAINPSETLVAAACDDRKAYIWNIETGEQIAVLQPHDWMVRSCDFSADGKTFVSATWSGELRVWDVESWTEKITFRLEHDHTGKSLDRDEQFVEFCRFHPDNKHFITIGHSQFAFVWDIETGNCVNRYDTGDGSMGKGVDVSPDGKYVLLRTTNLVIVDWETSMRVYREAFPVSEYDAKCCRFLNGDPSKIIFSPRESTIALMEFSPEKKTVTELWSRSVRDVLSCNGSSKRIVATTSKKEVHVFDINGDLLKVIDSHTEWIDACIAIGYNVYSCSQDRTVRGFVTTDAALRESDEGDDATNAAVSHSDDVKSVCGFGDKGYSSSGRDIFEWDLSRGVCVGRLDASGGELTLSPDGTFLYAGGNIINTETRAIKTYNALSSSYSGTVRVTPDGRFSLKVAIGLSDDTAVHCVTVATGKSRKTKMAHTSLIRSLAITPDGTRVVTGSDDGKICVWKWPEETLIETHEVRSISMDVSPDGRFALCGAKRGFVSIVCLDGQGESFKGLEHFKADGDNFARFVTAASFTHDSRFGLSGGRDRVMKVWDVTNGQCVASATFEGGVEKIASSTGGHIIVGTQGGFIGILTLKMPGESLPAPEIGTSRASRTIELTQTSRGFTAQGGSGSQHRDNGGSGCCALL